CRTRSRLIYTQRSRAGLEYSAPTELKCGKWDIARKVESDRPSRARRSGRNKNDLAARLEWAAEKLREANSIRLREKVPTLSQRTRKNGAPALKRIRNDKYLSERSDGGDSSSTHASSPSRTSRRAAC